MVQRVGEGEKLLDVVMFRGRLIKSGRYELRIYIFAEYKERLERYAGREVEGVLIIRGEGDEK